MHGPRAGRSAALPNRATQPRSRFATGGALLVRRYGLVGRTAELSVVEDLIRALRGGQGGALFLAGEPGIGKTALVGEILERSRQRGCLTLSGRAAEFGLEVPFAVFTDALEHHLRSSPETGVESLQDDQLALLAIVFPLLASRTAGGHVTAQPDERHRLLRAMRALLDSLASRQPLVLALDDLHWADGASIDLLCHLLHTGFDNPVFLLLASRPAQSQSRLLTALEGAERHGVSRRIELAPLSPAEAEELMGPEIDAGLRRALSAPARTLLQGAAVLGEPFEPELAADTAGIEASEALDALDSLLDSDLIRAAEVPRRFRFRHPIVGARSTKRRGEAGGSPRTAGRPPRWRHAELRHRPVRITSSDRRAAATRRPSACWSRRARKLPRTHPRALPAGWMRRCACFPSAATTSSGGPSSWASAPPRWGWRATLGRAGRRCGSSCCSSRSA